MKQKCNKEIMLVDFLKTMGYSHNKIKQLFKYRAISINEKIVFKNCLLSPSDTLEIKSIYKKIEEFEILYEDHEILVVNKKAGLLSIANDKEKENTLYYKVSTYVKKKNKKNRIFIVHRLDKDTSGVILFTKNQKIKELLQKNWNEITERYYVALVHGKPHKKSGTILQYLKEEKERVYDNKEGKLAHTSYQLLHTFSSFSFLEITIQTGRKNQIRMAMKKIGHPIIGDRKYGIKDEGERLYLHAKKLTFIHPLTKRKYQFEADLPKEFDKLMKKE